METLADFIYWGSKITTDGDCSHEIKRRLLLGRKVMTNLESILKSSDITLPTKVRLVKSTAFPGVGYGCESWTARKAASSAGSATKSRPTLVTPWTAACQVPLSTGFSREEYWSGLPFPSPGDLLNPGIEPKSPALQADALLSEPPGKPCQFKQSLKGSVYFQVT